MGRLISIEDQKHQISWVRGIKMPIDYLFYLEMNDDFLRNQRPQNIFTNPKHYVNRPMGPLNEKERRILEREVGEVCPNLEFSRFYKRAGTGAWQIDTEDYLKFQCPAQSGKIPDECEPYKAYCSFMLKNNELLQGFDSVY